MAKQLHKELPQTVLNGLQVHIAARHTRLRQAVLEGILNYSTIFSISDKEEMHYD